MNDLGIHSLSGSTNKLLDVSLLAIMFSGVQPVTHALSNKQVECASRCVTCDHGTTPLKFTGWFTLESLVQIFFML